MPRVVGGPGDEDAPGGDDSFASRVEHADAWELAKKKALADPGPSWRDWFLYSGSKIWVALGFFIVDIWILEIWAVPFNALGLGLSIAAAVYLEFLAYRYLWYRFDPEAPREPGKFRPTLLRPREFGRWTPEEALAREGKLPRPDTGPRREDFL
ncbi:MAG TPA: hypothetical protein VK423_00280 [Thermoplasmata archaeon]|nr:hypothetical protein [Thermoplasmata archaeon]